MGLTGEDRHLIKNVFFHKDYVEIGYIKSFLVEIEKGMLNNFMKHMKDTVSMLPDCRYTICALLIQCPSYVK